MGGGVGDLVVEVVDDLRERKRQELRDMSRGWSGSVGLLYRWLEGSRGSGEAVVVVLGEVSRSLFPDPVPVTQNNNRFRNNKRKGSLNSIVKRLAIDSQN